MDHCEVPRWQILKSRLNNVTYEQLINGLKADAHAECIDVRTPEEYISGHVAGAININYLSTELADALELLDPKKTYFIYCRTGRRSLRVCIILHNLGFQHVFNLDSGIAEEPALELTSESGSNLHAE